MSDHGKQPFVRPARLPGNLGQIRTIMAADRTLMAWIRTSLSMLSFGFTIYKFLEAYVPPRGAAASDIARPIGLFLAGMGTLSIVMGTIEYWATLKDIGRNERFMLGRPALYIALILSISGMILYVSIATHAF
jgi:putative membrane protein